jgi:purine-cytosine permease-like protein
MKTETEKTKHDIIERFGLEPVPIDLRTTKWYDYFYIQIAFSVNAGNFLVPALAVIEGGLSFIYAVLSTVLGAISAFFFVSWLSLPGAVNGIPSQYAIRSIIGIRGAQFVSSPIRTLTSLYWFAVQTIGGTYVIKELAGRLFHVDIPFYFISIILAITMSILALIGFEAIKKATKYFIPILLSGQGIILYLFMTANVNEKTFLTVVTTNQSFSLSSFIFFSGLAFIQFISGVSSSSDMARYAKSEKHSFYGLFAGNATGYFMTSAFAAYSASALNHVNPFVSATMLTNSYTLITLISLSALLSMISINMNNAYTGGFSLLNSVPILGRTKSALVFGAIGVILSCFPALVTEAKSYISLLGAFIIPLSSVIITEFIIFKKNKIDIDDLEKVLGKGYQINKVAFLTIIIGTTLYILLNESFSPGILIFIFTSIFYTTCKKASLHFTLTKKKSSVSL